MIRSIIRLAKRDTEVIGSPHCGIYTAGVDSVCPLLSCKPATAQQGNCRVPDGPFVQFCGLRCVCVFPVGSIPGLSEVHPSREYFTYCT